MRSLFVALIVMGSALASLHVAAASAPTKPTATRTVDLSGRWLLDIGGSDFGPSTQARPKWRRDLVRHRGAVLQVRPQMIKIDGDTTHMEYTYRTDGRDAVNRVLGNPVHTVGHWNGGTLELVSKVRVMASSFLMTERWSLADGGRTLVIVRDSDSPLGKRTSRMVYHRE